MLFYSCERYPDCKFSSWDMPTTETCPDCGNILLYRRNKKTMICSNKDCKYKVENAKSEEKNDDDANS